MKAKFLSKVPIHLCILFLVVSFIGNAQFTAAPGFSISSYAYSLNYYDANTIWMAGSTKTYRSTNSGASFSSWTSVDTTNTPNVTPLEFSSPVIQPLSSTKALLYGQMYSSQTNILGIRKANQPSGNWGLIFNGTTYPEYYGGILDVAFGESNVAIAVGFDGLIIRSIDGGNKWSLISTAPIDESKPIAFSMYPNPTKDQLSIVSQLGKPLQLFIFDQQGKQVINTSINQSITLDVAHWAAGNYTLQCSDNHHIVYTSIVVKQ